MPLPSFPSRIAHGDRKIRLCIGQPFRVHPCDTARIDAQVAIVQECRAFRRVPPREGGKIVPGARSNCFRISRGNRSAGSCTPRWHRRQRRCGSAYPDFRDPEFRRHTEPRHFAPDGNCIQRQFGTSHQGNRTLGRLNIGYGFEQSFARFYRCGLFRRANHSSSSFSLPADPKPSETTTASIRQPHLSTSSSTRIPSATTSSFGALREPEETSRIVLSSGLSLLVSCEMAISLLDRIWNRLFLEAHCRIATRSTGKLPLRRIEFARSLAAESCAGAINLVDERNNLRARLPVLADALLVHENAGSQFRSDPLSFARMEKRSAKCFQRKTTSGPSWR